MNMKSWLLFFGFLLQVALGTEDNFQVPEPVFEAFSPKGLRVAVPDSREISSVEFFINLPDCPQTLIQEVNRTNGGYFVYWNPEVMLRQNEKLRYKLMIQRRGLYWKKEGTHVVPKVLPLSSRPNDTDCTENQKQQNQKLISAFPVLGGGEEHHKGIISTGKTSNLKSSYSTYKSSDVKPVTKSSMSTTSGTFFIKPSGIMEATGYKRGSSFDSTKREGEQWEHYQSELTAEELENMKNLYGSGFHDFPLPSGLFPATAKTYEKKYMTSESQSFPGTVHVRYSDSQPITTHKFHQTHKTHESSSFTNSKPVFQFSDATGGSSFESNRKSEKLYRMEPLTALPNPLPPQGTIFKATEFVREEHSAPVHELSQVQVDRETHRSIPPQKLVQVSSQSGEFSSHNQEIVKPVFSQMLSGSGRGDQQEYNSGNLQTVERQDYRSRHYLGNIFTTVKSTRVTTPQECKLVPGVDYTSTNNIREVEKYAYELGCLATLAESTTKEEIALMKQKNAEIMRKLETLELEVRRISNTCNCYE